MACHSVPLFVSRGSLPPPRYCMQPASHPDEPTGCTQSCLLFREDLCGILRPLEGKRGLHPSRWRADPQEGGRVPLEVRQPSTTPRTTGHLWAWWRRSSQQASGVERLRTDPSVRCGLASPSVGCSERVCGLFRGLFGTPWRVELESLGGELLNCFGFSLPLNCTSLGEFVPSARNMVPQSN